jgi:hypothetical protein
MAKRNSKKWKKKKRVKGPFKKPLNTKPTNSIVNKAENYNMQGKSLKTIVWENSIKGGVLFILGRIWEYIQNLN